MSVMSWHTSAMSSYWSIFASFFSNFIIISFFGVSFYSHFDLCYKIMWSITCTMVWVNILCKYSQIHLYTLTHRYTYIHMRKHFQRNSDLARNTRWNTLKVQTKFNSMQWLLEENNIVYRCWMQATEYFNFLFLNILKYSNSYNALFHSWEQYFLVHEKLYEPSLLYTEMRMFQKWSNLWSGL